MYKRRRTMHGEEWNGCWKRAEVPTASIKKEQQRAIIYASVLPFCIISLMSADGLFIRSFLFLVVGGSMNFPFIIHLCIIKDGEVLQSGRSCWTSLGVRSLNFCLAVGSSDRKMRWFISFFVHYFLRLFCWVGSTQQYVSHVNHVNIPSQLS